MAAHSGGHIDADGHVRDSDRNYRAYLDEPYKSRTGNLFSRGENFDRRMNGTLGTENVDAEAGSVSSMVQASTPRCSTRAAA
jgi:hypothetical protein